MPTTTIVTAYFPIRRFETIQTHHSVMNDEQYREKGNFITNLPYPMVIYCLPSDVSFFFQKRKDYLHQTRIIPLDIEELPQYHILKEITTLLPAFPVYNRTDTKDTPLYHMFMHSRPKLMLDAVNMNPFGTDRFLYIDYGIARVANRSERIHEWIHGIPEKVRVMEIKPYMGETPKDYFHNHHHNIAGGILSGSATMISHYVALYEQTLRTMIKDGWMQLDEVITGMLTYQYPELFTRYYGDYNNIIEYYNGIVNFKQTNLLFYNLQLLLNRSEYKRAYEMLMWMAEGWYYATEAEQYQMFVFFTRISYYINNQNPPTPEWLVKWAKQNRFTDGMKQFIEGNHHNLIFYPQLKFLISPPEEITNEVHQKKDEKINEKSIENEISSSVSDTVSQKETTPSEEGYPSFDREGYTGNFCERPFDENFIENVTLNSVNFIKKDIKDGDNLSIVSDDGSSVNGSFSERPFEEDSDDLSVYDSTHITQNEFLHTPNGEDIAVSRESYDNMDTV